MSDRADEIARNFEENVLRERRHPRSYGLFTIPEYPEFERGPGMWSTALDLVLTSLRYLAPATILTLFWGQQSFIFKLLKHIDSAIRSVVSNKEQKVSTLKWLEETALVRVDSLETVWRHGWILCSVLDSVMPGACAGHPPTQLSLKHAQSIADNYLGVEPVFSRQELESNDSLSKHQEWKLLNYLDRIRQSLTKLTPPYVKPIRRKSTTEITQFTFDYVARGTGLSVAQLHNRMYFKIYPTAQQCMDPGEVTVLIRGPKDTYGITVLPPILGKAQMIRQTLLGLKSGGTYTHNALPLTQGATYLRAYGRNDMNKTYFIPKAKYDIDIEVDTLQDHVRIGYIVKYEGNYEISITSQGQNIVGSPFTLKASVNIIDEIEKESFRLEDGEEIDIVDVNNDKKVVFRIVDFVTEKMLLKEDGSLEKITEEEAKQLMSSKKINCGSEGHVDDEYLNTLKMCEHGKLRKTAHNVLIMKRVCNLFCNAVKEKRMSKLNKDKVPLKPTRKQGIPDVVNSTLAEITKNPFFAQKNKLITPENISVSLCTEKSKYINGNEVKKETKTMVNVHENKILDENNDIKIFKPQEIEYNELTSLDRVVHQSSNPFLSNTTYESSYLMEKDLGSFVKTEYETNNSQNEETDNSLVKIFIEKDSHTPSPVNNNPFIEPDILSLERPKTPILKIITGEVKNRDDSVYVQPNNTAEEILKNKPTNPFLATPNYEPFEREEKLAVTDFIIGAPVSLPPIIKASSPEPEMGSFIVSDKNFAGEYTMKVNECDNNNKDTNISILVSNQQTLELKPSEIKIQENTSNIGNLDAYVKSELEEDNFVRKKDLWDSAYVSIDDNNSTADSNNNDHTPLCESPSTQRASPQVIYEFQHEDLANMGPAEKEIWLSELSNPSTTSYHDIKPVKLEIKKSVFTPILEENDQNLKYQPPSKTETDSVTAAFADLDDMYCEYFPEQGNIPIADTKVKSAPKRGEQDEYKNIHVDSASDTITDVKRCAKPDEGEISEVQVTESVSASRILHSEDKEQLRKIVNTHTNEGRLSDNNKTGIVIEKKKYWDEKIREIEAAEEEERKSQQKIRRSISKTMRQSDSLSKKKGRQIVKNFLTSGGNFESRSKSLEKEIGQETKTQQEYSQTKVEEVQNNTKLVEKWKQYWDNKLEVEREEKDTHLIRATSPQQFTGYTPKDNIDKVLPKQELSEEVFKAFETSPKRFFGTSRKQILNKIDSFLGKQTSVERFLPTEVSNANLETGLVSSRITLFHDISNTEESTWKQRNCKSLHNIFQRINNVSKNLSQDRDVNVKENHKLQTEESEKSHFSKIEKPIGTNKSFTLEDKRTHLKKKVNSLNFEDISVSKTDNLHKENGSYVKKIPNYDSEEDKKSNSAQKISSSKSEMDIFNKISQKSSDDDLDKRKSYEELQKTKVKTFISLYENVSKSPGASKPKNIFRESASPQKQFKDTNYSLIPGTAKKNQNDFKKSEHQSMSPFYQYSGSKSVTPTMRRRKQWVNNKNSGSDTTKSIDTDASIDYIEIEIIGPQDESGKQSTYLSLSDMELEIIENPGTTTEPKSERNVETLNVDHKSRFETAKQYFKSLEELRVPKKFHNINECKKLLYKSTESLKDRTPRRVKKNIKYNSVPSSDIAKAWKELQEKENESSKLVKISEKFNVDDLYSDIMDGRLSRQGSLRGIPHKKAVLETFRSMENLSNNKLSSYGMPDSHATEFGQGKIVKNAQTYLTEYPYLPMTDPSQSQSRLDTKASGLISMKELLKKRPRRNSVPNLKLNSKESFTVDL